MLWRVEHIRLNQKSHNFKMLSSISKVEQLLRELWIHLEWVVVDTVLKSRSTYISSKSLLPMPDKTDVTEKSVDQHSYNLHYDLEVDQTDKATVQDQSSYSNLHSVWAKVLVELACFSIWIVDTIADTANIGARGKLLKLYNCSLHVSEKPRPNNMYLYKQLTFTLDGFMELELKFNVSMKTTVYGIIDAITSFYWEREPTCFQLYTYLPDVIHVPCLRDNVPNKVPVTTLMVLIVRVCLYTSYLNDRNGITVLS